MRKILFCSYLFVHLQEDYRIVYNLDKNKGEIDQILNRNRKYVTISGDLDGHRGDFHELQNKPKDKTDSEKLFLEPNHTHFLLVDNGTNNQQKTEIDLRMLLESKLDIAWENTPGKYYK